MPDEQRYVVNGYPGADWAANARAAGTGTLARATLSDANARRPVAIFAETFERLSALADRTLKQRGGGLALAYPQPVVARVIGSFMGIPPEDDETWARIMNTMMAAGDPEATMTFGWRRTSSDSNVSMR